MGSALCGLSACPILTLPHLVDKCCRLSLRFTAKPPAGDFNTCELFSRLVDVGRGAKSFVLAVERGSQPLNHNKLKCNMCPNNNNVRDLEIEGDHLLGSRQKVWTKVGKQKGQKVDSLWTTELLPMTAQADPAGNSGIHMAFECKASRLLAWQASCDKSANRKTPPETQRRTPANSCKSKHAEFGASAPSAKAVEHIELLRTDWRMHGLAFCGAKQRKNKTQVASKYFPQGQLLDHSCFCKPVLLLDSFMSNTSNSWISGLEITRNGETQKYPAGGGRAPPFFDQWH